MIFPASKLIYLFAFPAVFFFSFLFFLPRDFSIEFRRWKETDMHNTTEPRHKIQHRQAEKRFIGRQWSVRLEHWHHPYFSGPIKIFLCLTGGGLNFQNAAKNERDQPATHSAEI